jgi:Phosphodiester glycosidase
MNYLRLYLTAVSMIATSFIYTVAAVQADPQPNLPIPNPPINRTTSPPTSQLSSRNFVNQGTEILLNGKTVNIPWGQWQVGNSLRLGISDTALAQQLGVELFNNTNYQTQPIDWYASQRSRAISLIAKLSPQYRYLDITEQARNSGWQWQIFGSKLQLNTPATRVTNIQRQIIPKNGKIIVTLAGETSLFAERPVGVASRREGKENRATPWKLSQTPTEGYLTIEANADPALLSQFNIPPIVDPANIDPDDDPTAKKLEYKVTSNNNQTIIQFPIVKGQRARGKLLSSTNLEISINPSLQTIPDREINWAPGLKWRQKWVGLGANNFPVSYLEIDPRQKGIKLRPILPQEPTLVGSNHLIKFAPLTPIAAAINGGYFNRNNRMPLGAIKRDRKWLSSPILNRGAIGWNDNGQILISRLQMQETLTTSNGEQLPILSLNSGYVQTGISRYTSEWGKSYSPIQADELIITVEGDPRLHLVREQVTQITPGNAIGSTNIPIPVNGYLLALRGQPELSGKMPIRTNLTLNRQLTPSEFDQYPQTIAAGPWLVQASRVVLDAKTENFGAAFSKEAAVRSAIARLPSGNIILVAVHGRAGGKGPTLAEMAQLLQQMGSVDALNLDGGSSTSLYLGGQLVDRASATAARVHNAIGISIEP